MRNGSELSPCSESGVREARIPGKRGLRAEQAADGDRQLFAMSFVFSLDLIGVKRPTGRYNVYHASVEPADSVTLNLKSERLEHGGQGTSLVGNELRK